MYCISTEEKNDTDIYGHSPYIEMKNAIDRDYENNQYEATISSDINESIMLAREIIQKQMKIAGEAARDKIYRPDVRVLPGLIFFLCFVTLSVLAYVCSYGMSGFLHISEAAFVILVAIADAFIVAINIKKFVIWLIETYQRFAPDNVRLSCRFEPTCSQYMKLAINKYGVLRGVLKGLHGLSRCHPPNCGEDYP